eukprot:CAMPEP_0179025724 /NCGR_PEP_ID=MMETSP0796-20121207/8139_1 /TAXON_ID=73915 /ORGANISM="Pyrodinium bahamense, Strain pbaha01" /LENGTH=376 /DNA_ID=CAMNT_0020721767 /DNA_START=51 /DNA_END=1181 /DNA_ORIENTATION=+
MSISPIGYAAALIFLLCSRSCAGLRMQVDGPGKHGKCEMTQWGVANDGYLKGVQFISHAGPLKPMRFNGFHHGSNNREGLFVYPETRFAFCLIEKVGCSSWATVFNKVTRKIWNIKSPWYGVVGAHWSEDRATRVFTDEGSTRVVWVRDPLERLLSGFLNKCTKAGSDFDRLCPFKKPGQAPGFPFSQVLQWLTDGGDVERVDSHFTPQSSHCELHHRLLEYNTIGLMSKASFARDASCILERAGMGYANTQGKGDNSTFFNDPVNVEVKAEQAVAYLKKFFTREAARAFIQAYKEDYALFRIREPEWIEEATGEWFFRRANLTVSTAELLVPGRGAEDDVASTAVSMTDVVALDVGTEGDEDDIERLAQAAGFFL